MRHPTLYLLSFLTLVLPACKSGDTSANVSIENAAAVAPVKDATVVWDRQERDGNTYLLVQNLVGFSDVLEGVKLYKYPSNIDQTPERYSDKYVVFDEGVDSVNRSKSGDHHRSVKSAKFDLKRKRVLVTSSTGPNQEIDVSKYTF